jgi:hypothetical protein
LQEVFGNFYNLLHLPISQTQQGSQRYRAPQYRVQIIIPAPGVLTPRLPVVKFSFRMSAGEKNRDKADGSLEDSNPGTPGCAVDSPTPGPKGFGVFVLVRPAGRTYLEVEVLYSPDKGKS